MSTTTQSIAVPVSRQWSPFTRYRRSLWLLTTRDLKVRYTTSALGWFWSILDPLLMSLIYWFVFTQVFHRGATAPQPYIVFLLSALLPWTWFSGAVSDTTSAFTKEAKLIHSTTIPRTIWVGRLVLSKGIEFLFSLPVLALFALGTEFTDKGARLHWDALLYPLAILIQAVLIMGIGLIVAPLVVFFRDLERAIKLILRFAFYASPVVYSLTELQTTLNAHHRHLGWVADLNPLAGIMGIYRSAFFPTELHWTAVAISAAWAVVLFGVGMIVFRRSLPAVLKEI